jgi:magnesium transporter
VSWKAIPRLKLGPPAVLSAVIRQVIDDYGPTIDGLEHDVLEAEAQVFADTRHRPVKRLYLLRRQVRELLVAADSLYEPLSRLVRTQGGAQCASVVDELNESVELLNRVVLRTRTLSDLLISALDANLTQVSLQQNEDMRRISAWVAIGVAPTLLAGIYGMNFDHMPELHSRWGYPFALALMLTVALVLHRAFKRSEWL